ncbi:hypothetical protein GCM10023149_28670 [Mucilaginibacter gynuensis]|uniref:Uncharacterized protein n=1 Tax=Mucilaginibacter gynuensis TaxID=1302236 RepID=A0ABP8GLC9_9SPHI
MKLIRAMTSFWKVHDFPYIRAVEISDEELLKISLVLTREDLIEWLIWNDRNGIYSDEDSINEFGQAITREEALKIFIRQITENRPLMRLI